jgi:ABC-2 type transport system ATP-binding protein
MIESQELTRRYGDFTAVDDVSFRIERGEIVGLLGHNGAGKTTIMKMLTGYLEPSSGSARIDGIDVERDPLGAQRLLGYLPENLPLYPEMGVMEYLGFVAELRGCDPKVVVPAAMAATELQEKAFATINTLSRGFRQRLGVAQAILHEPECLILDEPTNGLDPSQTQHMRALIQRLAGKATVVLSTHIMQEVNAICDRVLILRGGRLVLDERLEALRASDRLSLRLPVDADPTPALRGVAGIGTPQAQGPGLWHLPATGSLEAAAAAATRALVGADLPVYALAPVQRDLETVFRSVSEGESAHAS